MKKNLLVFTAVFIVISLPYLTADLWMDEVISLWDYWNSSSLSEVFCSYPIPNNHIFFSALMWSWCHCIDNYLDEFLLRLPSLLFMLSIALIIALKLKSIFPKTYLAAVLTLFFSPVLVPFFFQLRGYGISILLSTLGTLGGIDLAKQNYKKGLLFYIPPIILLPGIMPSNLLLSGSLLIFSLLTSIYKKHIKKEIYIFIALFLALIISILPYFLIWKQFIRVTQMPLGWNSSFAVLTNITLSLLTHLLIPVLILIFIMCKNKIKILCSKPSILLSLISLCVIFATSLLRKPAPYPRVYLVFFPIFTISIFSILEDGIDSLKHFNIESLNVFIACMLLFLINYFIWIKVTDITIKQKTESLKYPQSLLEQYYRCKKDASKTAIALIQDKSVQNYTIISGFYQWATFRHYWVLYGGAMDKIVDARILKSMKLNQLHNVLILATSKQEAGEILCNNRNVDFQYLEGDGIYKLFRVEKLTLKPL